MNLLESINYMKFKYYYIQKIRENLIMNQNSWINIKIGLKQRRLKIDTNI